MADFTRQGGAGARPYVTVTVRNGGRWRAISALVDTGSDRTQIPLDVLTASLQAPWYRTNFRTEMPDGRILENTRLYLVTLEVPGEDGVVESFVDLAVSGSPSRTALIGRDVLSRFVLTMVIAEEKFALVPYVASSGAPASPAGPSPTSGASTASPPLPDRP